MSIVFSLVQTATPSQPGSPIKFRIYNWSCRSEPSVRAGPTDRNPKRYMYHRHVAGCRLQVRPLVIEEHMGFQYLQDSIFLHPTEKEHLIRFNTPVFERGQYSLV